MVPSQPSVMKVQRKDIINEDIRLKEKYTKLRNQTKKGATGPVKRLFREWQRVQMENGLLWRKTQQRRQLVLPENNRAVVLKHLHDEIDHVRTERVVKPARVWFYWPYMKKENERSDHRAKASPAHPKHSQWGYGLDSVVANLTN